MWVAAVAEVEKRLSSHWRKLKKKAATSFFFIMRLFLFSLHVNSHVSSLPLCCIPKVAAGRGLVPEGSRAERASGPRRSVAAAVHPHRFRSKNPKLMFH